jgi:hypothetical protein
MTRHAVVLEEVLSDCALGSRHGRGVGAEPEALWWAIERPEPEEPMQ